MKAMKANEIREQTVEELLDKERELSQQLFTLRLQKATGQLESPGRMRGLKKDLARVLTVLNEKRKAG
jgi:large subunit ribosomal protein L29